MDLYRADTNPAKLDLGVGVYKDAQGLTPIPRAVKLAEQRLLDSEQTKSYIGGHGDAQFGALLLRQVLGSRAIALGEQRAGCTQAPGGTGALRLNRQMPRQGGLARSALLRCQCQNPQGRSPCLRRPFVFTRLSR